MQVIKTLETNNNTYYCGYISKYEKTKAEKDEILYMIKQKLIGVVAIILSLVLVFIGAAPALLLTIVGIAVTFTKDHVVCI